MPLARLLLAVLALVPALALAQERSLVSTRVVVSGERHGPRHVKWLNRIEVRRVPDP